MGIYPDISTDGMKESSKTCGESSHQPQASAGDPDVDQWDTQGIKHFASTIYPENSADGMKESSKTCGESSHQPQASAGDPDVDQWDTQGIKDFASLDFSHVLHEPSATPLFAPVWRLSALTFRTTHRWTYRLLVTPLALPLAFAWGLVFAVLSLTGVWLMTPALKIVQLVLVWCRQVVEWAAQASIAPVYRSCSNLFSGIKVTQQIHTV